MKKTLGSLVFLLLLTVAIVALGETAADLTSECEIIPSAKKGAAHRLWDGDYTTHWKVDSTKEASVAITLPEGKIAGGIYICFGEMPARWSLAEDSGMVLEQGDDQGFAHVYIPLNGAKSLVLTMENNKANPISINELFVFGQGEPPEWVQCWEPTVSKADILVLSAHPDDEHLYMGGTIPYYSGELQKNVVVAYMTYATTIRRSELLNGLWAVGHRNYPVFGGFRDKLFEKLDPMYNFWGRNNVRSYIVELYRKYKPDVVVTHDLNGEYGHGAHMVCAHGARYCLDLSADAEKFPESAELYGLWDVPKLYLHLYKENQILMDWRQPLEAFDGKTAFEMAELGYAQHVTQKNFAFRVKDSGAYNCAKFGLVRSLVGEDVMKNDFLENIPQNQAATASPLVQSAYQVEDGDE